MEPEELYDGVSQLGVILTEMIEFGFTFATSLLECLSDADEQVFAGRKNFNENNFSKISKKKNYLKIFFPICRPRKRLQMERVSIWK